MKALISDIHANLSALESTLSYIDQLKISDIICLGDIAGYHTDINECIDLLRKRNIACIMGNHDYYLVNGENIKRSKTASEVIRYQREIISEDNLKWLSLLDKSRELTDLNIVHGGWEDNLNEYIYKPREHIYPRNQIQYYASGHTHIPVIEKIEDILYCNPGSVGQPRDGNCKASFATFDGEHFSIHRVAYDIKRTQNKMRKAGFSEYYFKNLSKGLPIGSK